MGPRSWSAWASYDSVADAYESIAAPRFAAMARDVVDAVDPVAGEVVLDVGTGTGLAAALAAGAVGTSGCVVGADPSPAMLSRIRRRSFSAVVAMVPGLPFRPGVFDAAVANLVISHLSDRHAGLSDVARVLRPGGRFACSAWSSVVPTDDDDQYAEANAIVAAVRAECGLDIAVPPDATPWEDWFRDREHVLAAVREAGLVDARIDVRTYRWQYTCAEFASGWGSQGRFLRHHVGLERWEDFTRRAVAALEDRFGARIVTVNAAWIASARKP